MALVLCFNVRFAVGDHVALDGKVACSACIDSVSNIATPRQLSFRVDVIVKHVDGISAAYDDSVPAARADFRLADRDIRSVADRHAIAIWIRDVQIFDGHIALARQGDRTGGS